MMIVAGDNPTRVRSEAAFAKLCGACPIPASSGVTHRHRLFRGGHRQANAAIYRIVTVRMRWHQPTLDYVGRRTAQGLTKKDIIRCLKRFVAREIYNALIVDHRSREAPHLRCLTSGYGALLTHRGFNAVIESFFSTLKTELVDRFPSFSEAKMELFDYIEPFYNQRRRHSTLGQISPAAFERQAVA